MWRIILADAKTGDALHTHAPFDGEEILVVTSFHEEHGQFKPVTLTAQGTAVVTQPDPGGAIVITSFLISARKKNLSVVTLRFTDGANTENIFSAELTNDAVNMPVSFVPGWRGWEDARLEVVLTGADTTVNVTAGYTKIPGSKEFSEWDGLR